MQDVLYDTLIGCMILDQHEMVYFLKDVIDQYGVDATRLAILGTVPPKANREWSEQGST